jgi:archaeal flagellar protein FlaJ
MIMAENSDVAPMEKLKKLSLTGLGISILFALIAAKYISIQAGMMFALAGTILCIIPISIYQYVEYNRYRKMEEHFPSFLEDFAEAKKTGMTFPMAFMTISKTDYGSLSSEIKKSANHLSWSVPFPKVMERLSKRMSGSRLIHQAFTIVNEAYNSGGNVAETMTTLAMNITKIKQIEDERKSIMSQQVFVIYFIFLLFVGILIGLYQVLIPMTDLSMQQTNTSIGSESTSSMGILGKPMNFCASVSAVCDFGRMMGFDEKGIYFKSLFLLMALIQGISSGFVAGQIGEGDTIAGVKHAGIMCTITMMSFIILF